MSNRPALPSPTVRRIERVPGYLTAPREYDPSRHCRGKRGLCRVMPQWAVMHHIHRGYRRSFYCDECLPAKHRSAAEEGSSRPRRTWRN